MTVGLQQTRAQIVDRAIQAVTAEFSPAGLEFTVAYEPIKSCFRCRAQTRMEHDENGKLRTYYAEQYLDEVSAVAFQGNQVDLFTHALKTAAVEVIESIPEEVIGAYPFARMWHDIHSQDESLTFAPQKQVPGWVFGVINKKGSPFPKDKPRKKKTLQEVDVDDSWIQDVARANDQHAQLVTEYDKMKEALGMATNTKGKKVRVVRAPIKGFDPSKVKTPECKEHRTPMTFDYTEQKWHCTYEGCGMVARPKRDADDKNVILGKGNIQMRLIAQDGKRNVVLISDDNIALDITKFVDVDEIISTFDVEDQAKVASENGKQVFAIGTHKSVVLSSTLMVMGADELTE